MPPSRRPRCSSGILILALVLASVPGRALADPGRSVRTYRDTIENATAAFAAGRFGDARAAFEVAYAIHPDPVLVFNIASCWRRAGDATQALVEYRRFLMLAPPDDERRPLATVTIASLEQDLQPREPELLRLQPPEPEPFELTAILPSPAAAAPAPRRSRLRPIWIGLGALGGLGAVTGVVELARSRTLEATPPAPEPATPPPPAPAPAPERDRDDRGKDGDRDDDDWDGGGDGGRHLTARSRPVAVTAATGERDSARRRAILLGVSGAALIAASVTVYYFGKRAERRALRLSVSGGGGGSSVVLGGQF